MNVKNFMLVAVLGSTAFPVLSDWEPYKGFAGLGLSNGENLLLPDNVSLSSDLVPELSLGVSKAYRLDHNWLIDTSLSLEWAKGNFQFQNPLVEKGNTENVGLWASSRLIRENWFENASPFIELRIGRVNADYSFTDRQRSEWATSARARVGMTFSLSEGSDLSISVGTSDFIDN